MTFKPVNSEFTHCVVCRYYAMTTTWKVIEYYYAQNLPQYFPKFCTHFFSGHSSNTVLWQGDRRVEKSKKI